MREYHGCEVYGPMFKLGAIILIVWAYCFFCQNLPMKVSFALMMGGLATMGWGLLSERR